MSRIPSFLLSLVCGAALARSPGQAPLPRRLGKVPLGLSAVRARTGWKAVDVSEKFRRDLGPDELMLEFPRGLRPKGASRLLGLFRQSRLARLMAVYPPDFSRTMPWESFLKRGQSLCRSPGAPQGQDRVWQDGQTRITYARTAPAADRPSYYILVEDRPAAPAQAGPSAPVAAAWPVPECRSYGDCYSQADRLAKQGQCEPAVALYGKAIGHNPDNPWAWYHRGIIRKELGDAQGAGGDYAQALAREHNAQDFPSRNKAPDGGPEAFDAMYSGKCLRPGMSEPPAPELPAASTRSAISPFNWPQRH